MNKPASSYKSFLDAKRIADVPTGFAANGVCAGLFDFQRDIVKWSCRRGRAALWEDCGLGKTPQQLAWAQQVIEHADCDALVVAPLGVTHQTVREGAKFGIDAKIVRDQAEVSRGISVTNYEKLHKFNVESFGAVVLDESSILKSLDGATRNALIERCARTPYKLACSATPAPNDYMELGNHAEFLGVMTRSEMLSMFFVHDGGETAKWRLKGHAETEFWRWLCSWAVSVRKPSDLGYADGKFSLPPLKIIEHIVKATHGADGYLFPLPASSLAERRDARRATLDERVDRAAELADGEQWVFWCNLNAESDALANRLGAVEVRGDTPEDERERIIIGFLDGSIRRVVTKPSIWGFGLNMQCCHNTAFVGISDSYEQFYQTVRRFWRFGQTKPVTAHVIISDLEGAVLANIKRKERDAGRMADSMVGHMADFSAANIKGQQRETDGYNPKQNMRMAQWLK
jgi:hypothetical protein